MTCIDVVIWISYGCAALTGVVLVGVILWAAAAIGLLVLGAIGVQWCDRLGLWMWQPILKALLSFSAESE